MLSYHKCLGIVCATTGMHKRCFDKYGFKGIRIEYLKRNVFGDDWIGRCVKTESEKENFINRQLITYRRICITRLLIA